MISNRNGMKTLRRVARRSGQSVADLVRKAIRRVWLRPPTDGPVALSDSVAARISVAHDVIYDERQ